MLPGTLIYDLSNDHTQQVKDKFWLQHLTHVYFDCAHSDLNSMTNTSSQLKLNKLVALYLQRVVCNIYICATQRMLNNQNSI